jgi:serine/threonine protein kinase
MNGDESGEALIGVVLANSYEITRFIGRGGMGAVYEGRHMRLGQRVAIKIMAGDLASNREALVRFRREAEVTSGIRHPHIVHVFDFGSARTGEPFLVMEYLDGEDLEHRTAARLRDRHRRNAGRSHAARAEPLVDARPTQRDRAAPGLRHVLRHAPRCEGRDDKPPDSTAAAGAARVAGPWPRDR